MASEPKAGEPIFSFAQKMQTKRLEEPSLAIVAFDPEMSREMEIVTYKPLKQLALSIPGKFRAYEGFGVNGTRLSVLLYEYQKDPEIEGNVRLKFEVVDGEELLDIPLVSWNQEDDLDLCYGDCWLMKLTRNALVANE